MEYIYIYIYCYIDTFFFQYLYGEVASAKYASKIDLHCVQVVARDRDSIEDEELEEVVLVWNQGKKRKSIHDLAMDNSPEDREVLSYYR